MVIADAAKHVPALGGKFPLPIEVVAVRPQDHRAAHLRRPGGMRPRGAAALRMKDGAPVRTDSGNLIYDAACGRIEEPAALAAALKSVTGVVEHGLFLDLAELALIGGRTAS